jgi:hypothetical protein
MISSVILICAEPCFTLPLCQPDDVAAVQHSPVAMLQLDFEASAGHRQRHKYHRRHHNNLRNRLNLFAAITTGLPARLYWSVIDMLEVSIGVGDEASEILRLMDADRSMSRTGYCVAKYIDSYSHSYKNLFSNGIKDWIDFFKHNYCAASVRLYPPRVHAYTGYNQGFACK